MPVRRRVVALIIVLCAIGPQSAFGSTITVTSTADDGPGTLRRAIADAAPGDTIDFSVTGTITLTTTRLVIDKDFLTIAGPGADKLLISGNPFVVGVLTVAAGARAFISGVTIANGRNPILGGCGGDITNNSMLVIRDSVVAGGSAFSNGGDICNHGVMQLINSTVTSGSARRGAGVYNDGQLVVNGSLVTHNVAVSGGGIANVNGFTTLVSSAVLGNSSISGGGVYANFGGLDIINTTIDNNRAVDDGGGVYDDRSTLTLTNSTISNNQAEQKSGGGSFVLGGSLSASNSTFFNNFANKSGGGIYTNNGLGGLLVLFFTTFSDNRSSGPGGGIFSTGSTNSTMWMKGTILASSSANGLPGGNCSVPPGAINAASRRNLSDDFSCAGIMTALGSLNGTPAGLDPLGLRDNGGPTKTIALLGTSPAVDEIPLTDCDRPSGSELVPLTSDQRGIARPQGSQCDMGAFELVDSTPPVLTVPESVTVDATSPSGATVIFDVSASDPDDAAGPASCTPASGSFFPIGTTLVTCSSTDTHGNTGTASFSVTVLTPEETISNLIAASDGAGLQQFVNLLRLVSSSLSRGNAMLACNQLGAFAKQLQAQAGRTIDVATADDFLASAAHLLGSLGCR